MTRLTSAVDGLATTAWFVDLSAITAVAPATGVHIWIKATLPAEYLYQTVANAIVIHPEPMYGATLLNAQYNVGGADIPIPMPWTNYLGSNGRPAMPEMFLVPPASIVSVKFHYYMANGVGTQEERAFYLTNLGVYQMVFNASSLLALNLTSLVTPTSLHLAATGSLVNPLCAANSQPNVVVNTNAQTATVTLLNADGNGMVQTLRAAQIALST
jgi:hypothetical protein